MECACVYVGMEGAERPRWWVDLGFIPAKREVECCECGETIGRGELHEKVAVQWDTDDDHFRSYRTCVDCHSIRQNFFCEGWFWTMMHDHLWEHIVNIDGELSEDCLSRLTPGGRAVVCELIEELWVMDLGVGI